MKISDRLSIEESIDHRSCNVCHAKNYESAIAVSPDKFGRVDKLYDLTVGGTTISICKKCLKNLTDMIELNLLSVERCSLLRRRLCDILQDRGQMNGMEDDYRQLYLQYLDGEIDEVLVRQDYIRAMDIDCGGDAVSKADFPWHGRTYQHFIDITKKLQELLPEILSMRQDKEVREFRRKHGDVYGAYFERPIHVLLENGKYRYNGDGRHRIFAAAQIGGVLPVFVVEYAEIRKMTEEGFLERNCQRNWKF